MALHKCGLIFDIHVKGSGVVVLLTLRLNVSVQRISRNLCVVSLNKILYPLLSTGFTQEYRKIYQHD